jgi:hypothetical protein
MHRIAPVIASAVVGGLAVVALSACDMAVDGTGLGSSAPHGASSVGGSATPANPTTSEVTTTAPPTHSNESGTDTSGGTSHGGSSTTITASATCVIADYEDLPGIPHTPLYQPKLTWHVTHATGMALSVDNPGLVGSYGTYAAQGTLMLGGGCYKDEDDSTTITFYSVGSAGPRVHRTIVLNPTMNRPTAPPLANQTTTTTSNP